MAVGPLPQTTSEHFQYLISECHGTAKMFGQKLQYKTITRSSTQIEHN